MAQPLAMGTLDLFKAVARPGEDPIRRYQFGPLIQGLGQGSARPGSPS